MSRGCTCATLQELRNRLCSPLPARTCLLCPHSPSRNRFGNARGTLEGSRRAFSADFIRTLADDFRLHGRQAIEKVRKQQPAAYMKICALLVPREMKVEHSSGVKALTDEELEQAIAATKASLAARAGEKAKVIEGEAEVVPSLPAPASGAPRGVRSVPPKVLETVRRHFGVPDVC